MGTVHNAQGWRRARALGVLGVTGAAAAAVVFGLPNQATSGQLDAPCSEVAANCQVGDLANSVLALGSNGSTIFASDNFSRSTTGAITHLCFWALYNTNVPGTDNIVVTFYNDTLATSGSPGYPVGGALASFSGANVAVTRADTGLDFAGLDVYEYSVTLTGGFNATADTCYWVEISNAVAPADAWFILCADNAAGLGDERSMQRGSAATWGYFDVVTGSDLAVCINGGLNLPAPTCALPAACSSATHDCNVESANSGCVDPECCGLVCVLDAVCCFGPWDAICVDLAINGAGCAVAPYDCPAGGPANDCATNATVLSVPSGAVSFDLTSANTDGATINAACASGTIFDVWFIVEAPADGNISIETCGTSQNCGPNGDEACDLVVNVYDVGDGTYTGQEVLDEVNFLACADDAGDPICCPEPNLGFACPSRLNFFCTGGTNYLIRVGMFPGNLQAESATDGVIEVSYDPSVAVWNTGPHSPGLLNGAPANLGFSSGNLGGTNPERWQAHPMTLPAVPAGAATWHITSVQANGFAPAGVNNQTFHFIVWERNGINSSAGPPVDGDQLVTGMAAYPVPEGDTHLIETDFKLPPGDYWFTVYAGGDVAPNNFAWFGNAQLGPDGIPNISNGGPADLFGADGLPFMWRSFCVTPESFAACGANPQGFVAYRAANWTVNAGEDPQRLYTMSFALIGEPQLETACPGDCVTTATFAPPADGDVNAADLAFLLGDWGPCKGCCADTVTTATFQPPPDGMINAADLAQLLGNWGSPGCQ